MRKHILYAYVIIEIILYLTFMTLDIINTALLVSSVLKFAGIFLCLIMSVVIIFLYGCNKNRIIIAIAMMFTVISDVFLLFTDMFSIGITFFCIVQTIYLIWLCRLDNTMAKVGELEDRSRRNKLVIGRVLSLIFIRLALSFVVVLCISTFGFDSEFLYYAACFYAVSFIDNIRRAVVMLVTRRHQNVDVRFNLVVCGLILFFLCDVNVCLYNLVDFFSGFKDFLTPVYTLITLGMWLFYLPAQVMLTLSNATKQRLI